MSVLEPRVTSNMRLGFSILSNPSYFCMRNFVSGNKAQFTYSFIAGNKVSHTKVQYLPRYREAKSQNLLLSNSTVVIIISTATTIMYSSVVRPYGRTWRTTEEAAVRRRLCAELNIHKDGPNRLSFTR